MKKLRWVCFLFAAVMLTGAFAACGGGSGSAPAATTAPPGEGEAPAGESSETTSLYKLDAIDVKDYGGRVFRVLTSDNYPVETPEQTGDIVDDAQYKRNLLIEEKYDIKISDSYIPMASYSELTSTFKKTVMAASDDFDVCRLIMRDAFSLALGGYVMPVVSLPYADLESPWYVKFVNDALRISGNYYVVYTDECMGTFTGATGVFFNKFVITELGLDSPYDEVRAGSWTTDSYYEKGVAAIKDVNGDGVYTPDGGDRFADVGEYDGYIPPLWIGADMMMVKKDEDDVPYFAALGNEKFYTFIEKLYSYFDMDGYYWDSFLKGRFDENERAVGRGYFTGGQALYYIGGFGLASSFRAMENDFGLVPLPKYDEQQKDYYSRIADGWLLNVPAHCQDAEFVSAILEELAIGTKNYIIPAYYEDALKNKFIRDDDTLEMLDIIQTNKMLDLADTVWFNEIRGPFTNDVFVQGKPVASYLEKMEKKVNKAIEKALSAGE